MFDDNEVGIKALSRSNQELHNARSQFMKNIKKGLGSMNSCGDSSGGGQFNM
jgi:hypothetical protein